MGLSDSCAQINSQILDMDPLPIVSQVYSIIHQEKTQHDLLHRPLPTPYVVAMHVNRTQSSFTRDIKSKENTTITYEYCGKTRHSKSSCYQLIGFPTHWNHNRNSSCHDTIRQLAVQHVLANPSTNSIEHSIPCLTTEQYHQLIDLLMPYSTNFPGTSFSLIAIKLLFLI